MKTITGSIVILFFSIVIITSCGRSNFASINTDPDAVLTINVNTELAKGFHDMVWQDYETFYDYNQAIRPWTQSFVAVVGGNKNSVFLSPGNINQRWSVFYNQVGPELYDVQKQIDKMPAAQAANYQLTRAIAGIGLTYYAFYVTDADNYMPYTQAFQARYTTPPNFTPKYQSQQEIFDTLDAQLQNYVKILEAGPTATTVSPGEYDIFYQGSWSNWVKAANSLRLKIATRLIKRNPQKATAIFNAALADAGGVIDGLSSEWVFNSSTSTGGNANPYVWPLTGEKLMVDFMWKVQDPRMRNLYQPSGITSKDMFDSARLQGALPAAMVWDGQLYRGGWASPTTATLPQNAGYISKLNFSYKGQSTASTASTVGVYFSSLLQERMIYANGSFNATGTAGTGSNVIPLLTYADVCFMRAEMKLRGLSNDALTAQVLYTNGVTASITDYDAWANKAKVYGYTALGANEITTYLAQPGIVYNSTTALEQIYDQAFINFYLNPNEAWALVKRTGYPSSTGVVMPLEALGGSLVMPRRNPISLPLLSDLNYQNQVDAIAAEKMDPGFGDPADITGRVWWDQQ